jgi:phosphopantothenoylcysteine synthetase/decarboxylase
VGFGHETNAVVIISVNDDPITVDLASKTTIAQRVLDSVEKSLHRIQEHT